MKINPEYDYRPHLEPIADAYGFLIDGTNMCAREGNADALTPREFFAWAALAAHSVKVARMIRDGAPVGLWPDARPVPVRVHEVSESEPYPAGAEMLADMRAGRFLVSSAHCEHPVWTPAENVAFRIVHDVIGHGSSGGGFDWDGENAACGAHFPLLAPLARAALFTECIAQTGYAIARGGFGPQCVGFLPWGANLAESRA